MTVDCGYIMVGTEASDKVQRIGHELRIKDLEKPPEKLFVLGAGIDQILQHETIAIVGSRKVSKKSLFKKRALSICQPTRGHVTI